MDHVKRAACYICYDLKWEDICELFAQILCMLSTH